jgi:hypothetical protein
MINKKADHLTGLSELMYGAPGVTRTPGTRFKNDLMMSFSLFVSRAEQTNKHG